MSAAVNAAKAKVNESNEMLGAALIGRRKNTPSKARALTEEEIKDLRTAFDLLDRDQDGHVTPEELQFMLRNLGIHVRDELIDDLLREASRTGSGLIDETEFLQWVARIQALKEDSNTSNSSSSSSGNSTTQAADDDLTQDLVAAFRVFDRDGNGYITRDELKSAMDMIGENVTEYQLNEMLELADADKDGKINYEDFQNFFLNNIDTFVQSGRK
ncbi:calcium-binding protein E63-1 isoform X3 [Toxorhynchites rutilus septentrionalis]|uniref:calcium-binding protein E63-1 isoform X3 n=1 Tax=Toxorhynchites rutilus septentrionalis TaxID=329112 RepID=UPI00247AF83F|nr:calcium-binding protein E63-1 isoform X3 [Toxorhynchites rutilus septentrionalis]